MRTLMLASAFAWIGSPMSTPGPSQGGSPAGVLPIQAITPQGVRQGTCFVVHQDEADGRTTVWVVTSARLFDGGHPHQARILIGNHAVDVSAPDILMPFENHRDMAALRAHVIGTALSALPITFEQVHVGTSFIVSGYDAAGRPATVAEHVAMAATRALRGGRSISGLAGCQGAPALVEGRVIGIVSECASNQMPEITPMVVARGFLLRTIPRLLTQPAGNRSNPR